MSFVRLQLDLPALLHDASRGEIVFAALIVRSGLQHCAGRDVVEVPLRGYRDQPTLARVDFGHDKRFPKVTRVVGPLKPKVHR